jgi:hypothetical protein
MAVEKLLTVTEAAERAGVSVALVFGWCQTGILAHHRLGLPGRAYALRFA